MINEKFNSEVFNIKVSSSHDWLNSLTKYFGNNYILLDLPDNTTIAKLDNSGGYIGVFYSNKALGLVCFASQDNLSTLLDTPIISDGIKYESEIIESNGSLDYRASDFWNGLQGYDGIGNQGNETGTCFNPNQEMQKNVLKLKGKDDKRENSEDTSLFVDKFGEKIIKEIKFSFGKDLDGITFSNNLLLQKTLTDFIFNPNLKDYNLNLPEVIDRLYNMYVLKKENKVKRMSNVLKTKIQKNLNSFKENENKDDFKDFLEVNGMGIVSDIYRRYGDILNFRQFEEKVLEDNCITKSMEKEYDIKLKSLPKLIKELYIIYTLSVEESTGVKMKKDIMKSQKKESENQENNTEDVYTLDYTDLDDTAKKEIYNTVKFFLRRSTKDSIYNTMFKRYPNLPREELADFIYECFVANENSDLYKKYSNNFNKIESESPNQSFYSDVFEISQKSKYFTELKDWEDACIDTYTSDIKFSSNFKLNVDNTISNEIQAEINGMVVGFWNEKDESGYLFNRPMLFLTAAQVQSNENKPLVESKPFIKIESGFLLDLFLEDEDDGIEYLDPEDSGEATNVFATSKNSDIENKEINSDLEGLDTEDVVDAKNNAELIKKQEKAIGIKAYISECLHRMDILQTDIEFTSPVFGDHQEELVNQVIRAQDAFKIMYNCVSEVV